MEVIQKKVKLGLKHHLKRHMLARDVLKGDELILEALSERFLKTDKEYEELARYFKNLIYMRLDKIKIKKSTIQVKTPNKIDQEIINILKNIDHKLVREELFRLNQGYKKLLRANLVIKTSGDYKLAALIELFHLATLIQDDVIDKAKYRRFQETTNKKYSNTVAILISDILFLTIIFELAHYYKNSDIIENEDLISFCQNITQELITKMLASERLARDVKDLKKYEEYATFKTANLFMYAMITSYISSSPKNIDTSTLNDLLNFSKDFGIIFQKIDDLLDYKEDYNKSGKDSRDTINGVNNYILIMLKTYKYEEVVNNLKKELEALKKYKCYKNYLEEIEILKRGLYE